MHKLLYELYNMITSYVCNLLYILYTQHVHAMYYDWKCFKLIFILKSTEYFLHWIFVIAIKLCIYPKRMRIKFFLQIFRRVSLKNLIFIMYNVHQIRQHIVYKIIIFQVIFMYYRFCFFNITYIVSKSEVKLTFTK